MLGVKVLKEGHSVYNGHLKLIHAWGMGNYIQADGLTQSGGILKSLWAQTLKKIYKNKKSVKKVLILGFGGGTVSGVIHNLWPNSKIDGIDIDPTIVDWGAKYLGFNNKKVNIRIGDAYDFVKKVMPGSYDLVVVDLFTGNKFPKKFQSKGFIKYLKRSLAKNGVVIINCLKQKDPNDVLKKIRSNISNVFDEISEYKPVVNLILICT